MSLDLLTATEVVLSKEEYNATKSKIEFKLDPINPKKWTPIRDDMRLSVVSRCYDYFSSTIISLDILLLFLSNYFFDLI